MANIIKHKPLSRKEKLKATSSQRICRLILRCFNGLKFTKNSFRCGEHIMKANSGEVEFYEAGEVDRAINKLNRLVRWLE